MKKILITSASRSFIDRNESLLRRSAFRLLAAETAADAMKFLLQESVDLILIDIHLADMAGELFCAQLRSNAAVKKPFILLVCRDSTADFTRLKTVGADVLIARPIKPLQLIKTVGQFLTVQLIRSRRVSLRTKVISKKNPVEFFCLSHDISSTGMLLETEYSFEAGSIISCQFTLPGPAQLETEAEIVRSARTMDGAYQYGIRFTALTRQYRQEIDRYVAAMVRGDLPPAS
jgi:response regulator RpfG family c-di-GMP phosphodiesterase